MWRESTTTPITVLSRMHFLTDYAAAWHMPSWKRLPASWWIITPSWICFMGSGTLKMLTTISRMRLLRIKLLLPARKGWRLFFLPKNYNYCNCDCKFCSNYPSKTAWLTGTSDFFKCPFYVPCSVG